MFSSVSLLSAVVGPFARQETEQRNWIWNAWPVVHARGWNSSVGVVARVPWPPLAMQTTDPLRREGSGTGRPRLTWRAVLGANRCATAANARVRLRSQSVTSKKFLWRSDLRWLVDGLPSYAPRVDRDRRTGREIDGPPNREPEFGVLDHGINITAVLRAALAATPTRVGGLGSYSPHRTNRSCTPTFRIFVFRHPQLLVMPSCRDAHGERGSDMSVDVVRIQVVLHRLLRTLRARSLLQQRPGRRLVWMTRDSP